MKFALDANHFEYFEKNQYIEFDALLTENEIIEAQLHLEDVLRQSVHMPKKKGPMSVDNQFIAGHDLWRHHPFLRKMATKKQWAEIASQLIRQKPLRLGYDQLFPGTPPASLAKTDSTYAHFTSTSKSLVQFSSIQTAVCGLILCIKNPSMESPQNPKISFPTKQGNGLFIHPEMAIQFQELSQCPEALYMLFVYINDSAVYILNEQDPHTHYLKNLGYTFGDKLKEKTHPILFR